MKELEDYNWFPPVLRNFQTDFIGFFVVRFNVYNVFVDYLKTLALPVQSMTDLCSGSGEPATSIFRKSNSFSSLTLTDKYPRPVKRIDDKIVYKMKSIDVLEMEFKKDTCFTMFNAFHHFEDADKLKIIQKIQRSGADAFIVELLEPTVFCFFKIFCIGTFGTLLLAPFILPFSFSRLFFTYVIPVNIFTITYDGIVSVFKSRSLKQYQNLFSNTENPLKIFQIKNGLNTLIVLQIERAK